LIFNIVLNFDNIPTFRPLQTSYFLTFNRYPIMKRQLIALLFIAVISSCGTDVNKKYNDTTTSGTVAISSDETLMPLIDAEKDTFMGLYRYATLNISHKAESECFKDLINDSVKVVISTRKLNKSEEDYFKSRKLIPVTTKIAVDALAILVNKNNPDSLIQLQTLKSILDGSLTTWKQINPSSDLREISFVFDNNGSSNARFLKDSLLKGKEFSKNCFAAKSNPDVINYVKENKNAIGVIGVAFISDFDDPMSQKFLSEVKVLDISTVANPVYPDDYFKPYQAYIALGQYPLTREVYMISREGRSGLGTGFVSFVAGDAGQRIIRLTGLLPATMPVRIIQNN
jgi:phosphate transport system substrate-binding protein